jgi:purine-binding chemotaxis protein CheW
MFTINVASILEVIETGEEHPITHLPKAPEYIEGVVNFRGEILPIVNSRIKLDMPNYGENEYFVIIVYNLSLNNQSVQVGMMADKVVDVIEIEASDIRPISEIGLTYDSDFIDGVVLKNKEFITLLNIEEILSCDDIVQFKQGVDEKQEELSGVVNEN